MVLCSLSSRSGTLLLLLAIVAGCERSTRIEPHPPPPKDPSPSPLEDDPPAVEDSPVAPTFTELPDGWVYSCRACECATLLNAHAGSPGIHGWEVGPSYRLDVAGIGADTPSCSEVNPSPESCLLRADFDGDGSQDLWTPILGPDYQAGFAVAWGSGAPLSTVGPGDAGHLSPVPSRSGCATLFEYELSRNGAWTVDDISTVEGTTAFPGAPTPHHRFALELRDGTWIGFDGRSWRVALPARRRDSGPPSADPWTSEQLPPLPPSCSEARSIRKKRFKAHEALQWHPAGKVARDPCTLALDFDADGSDEAVTWVVVDDMPGLQITGLPRGTALFGAGRSSRLEVLDGEPGCNHAPASLDDVWDVNVARWDGSAWHLPDGRAHVPAAPELVDGPGLAVTNAEGHVDVLFLSEGEWKTSAVPFDWDEHLVFWPAMEQWNWIAKPLPAMQRYRRPAPALHSWVTKHTPGPRPKTARPFYPGR